ncbi:MAG TPA: alpha/beta hydrolase [Dehalococcoidia bacterium]|nr:alpha/beta hydrolase [Dehalococcoidia bacterium]
MGQNDERPAPGGNPTGEPIILLPGIIMPAALRYAPLLEHLGDAANAIVKDLEVYAGETPPSGYSIDLEVEGVSRAADEAGFERFHLYGHSAGGACAIAYAAVEGERILSLALDEPASDFSDEVRAELGEKLARLEAMPRSEQMRGFVQMQLAPGVEPPPPPPGPPPEWMKKRPAGIDAFTEALQRHRIDVSALSEFSGPVYYSFGSLSNPSWKRMRDRLAELFPKFTAEEYKGLHHFNTSHAAEPARVAQALRQLWDRSRS